MEPVPFFPPVFGSLNSLYSPFRPTRCKASVSNKTKKNMNDEHTSKYLNALHVQKTNFNESSSRPSVRSPSCGYHYFPNRTNEPNQIKPSVYILDPNFTQPKEAPNKPLPEPSSARIVSSRVSLPKKVPKLKIGFPNYKSPFEMLPGNDYKNLVSQYRQPKSARLLVPLINIRNHTNTKTMRSNDKINNNLENLPLFINKICGYHLRK